MSLELRAARRDDFPEIMEVLRLSFDEVAPDFFADQTNHDSTFRYRHARVALINGSVAGYVRIFARRMLVRGTAVPAGGIGSVATHPEVRHSGIATALLEDAIAQMRREGMRLSFLFTGIPGFYERLGYRIARQPEFAVSRAAIIDDPRGYTHRARQMDLPTDFPMLLRIYREASHGLTGRIARTRQTWFDTTLWLRAHTNYVTLDPRSLKVCGYIRSRCRDFGHQVLEAECRPGTEDAVMRQLLRLVAFRQCDCGGAIVASAGTRTLLAAALRAIPGVRETEDVRFPMMVLPLDGDPSLARALEEEPIAFWNSDRI